MAWLTGRRAGGLCLVLLVTSALHMPWALAVFEAVFAGTGVTFLPAATDAEALGDVLASKPRRNAPGGR